MLLLSYSVIIAARKERFGYECFVFRATLGQIRYGDQKSTVVMISPKGERTHQVSRAACT